MKLRDLGKEGSSPRDHQEADLTEFRERSHWAIPTKMVPNYTAWVATVFHRVGFKAPAWCGRTRPPPTSHFLLILPWQGLVCNATSCHPVNSFPPGLKNDSSVYGGKVVCAKPSGFVVTGQTTWGRDGGGDRRNNTGPLPGDSLSSQQRPTTPQWALRTRRGSTESPFCILYSSQNFNVCAVFDKQEWSLCVESTSLLADWSYISQ